MLSRIHALLHHSWIFKRKRKVMLFKNLIPKKKVTVARDLFLTIVWLHIAAIYPASCIPGKPGLS